VASSVNPTVGVDLVGERIGTDGVCVQDMLQVKDDAKIERKPLSAGLIAFVILRTQVQAPLSEIGDDRLSRADEIPVCGYEMRVPEVVVWA
jgi:hypothetical protein